MTCFEGGFRWPLFFLENSRKRSRTAVLHLIVHGTSFPYRSSPRCLEAPDIGADSQFVLVSVRAKCLRDRRRKGGRVV